MAGATVYQLSVNPIDDENIMTEESAYEYDQMAEYVYEVGDRMSAETYFADKLLTFNTEQELVSIARKPDGTIESITFREGFQAAYFAPSYAKYMASLAKLSTMSTPEDFLKGALEEQISRLQSAYNNQFGDYVYTEDCEFVTFDDFIRYVAIDMPYYLGGILGCQW